MSKPMKQLELESREAGDNLPSPGAGAKSGRSLDQSETGEKRDGSAGADASSDSLSTIRRRRGRGIRPRSPSSNSTKHWPGGPGSSKRKKYL